MKTSVKKPSVKNPFAYTIAPQNLNGDAFLAVEYVSTDLHDPVRDRWDEGTAVGGVRLYCTQSPSFGDAARWHLQVRAQVKTRSGRSGKHFAVSTASMSREAMRWLRDAIDAELRRKS